MFGNYSIEAATQHPSSLRLRDDDDDFSGLYSPNRPASPFDTRTSYPSAPLSLSQLSQCFDAQSLSSTSGDTDRCPQDSYFQPIVSPAVRVDDPFTSRPVGRPLFMRSPGSSLNVNRKVQRQRDVRRLCEPDHLRNISELVARMIDSGDQCGIASSPERSTVARTSSSSDDEAYTSTPLSSPSSVSSTSSSEERRNSWFESSDYSSSTRRSSELFTMGGAGLSKVSSRVEKSRPAKPARRISGRVRMLV